MRKVINTVQLAVPVRGRRSVPVLARVVPARVVPVLAGLVLTACSGSDRLDAILEQGELHVVSRNSPSTYYLDKNGAAGFEYDLAQLFADELGVELVMQPAFNLEQLFERLRRGEADIAAASLSLTSARTAQFTASAAYARQTPLVIYKTGSKRPRDLGDIGDRQLLVVKNSSHEEILKARSAEFPTVDWQTVDEADPMELLERVASNEQLLAVIDSGEFNIHQSLYPRLDRAFALGGESETVWYMPPGSDSAGLREAVDAFFSELDADGRLERLREQHFGHANVLSRIDSHTFALNMERVLPKYEAMIREVAREYQLDWHLLAAVAYQESHWNPKATSPTGVRGMMMLTRPTARELGVDNRIDPLQSLRGGARYLKSIRRRLSADISEPDRTWMALAAYNIGLGHLEDARVLTERQGGDPDRWQEVMGRLPLLQKRQYYRDLRYGYARGREAANYVQNIRHYYSILQWQASPVDQWTPPVDVSQHMPASLRGEDIRTL